MKPLVDRFNEKFVRGEPHDCWLWFANKNNMGYGLIRPGGTAPKQLAHRVAYVFANGPIPEGMIIMHKCDTPACVNPNHLVLGTYEENTHDRGRKERQNNTSITNAQARTIKALLDIGVGPASISRTLGVGRSLIKHLKYGGARRYL